MWQSAKDWVPIAALGVVVLGYLAGSWRRGLGDSWKETLELQRSELLALKEQNDRMRSEGAACKEGILRLTSEVQELRTANSELRSMVVLDKAPPALEALQAGMTATTAAILEEVSLAHARQVAELSAHFIEALHPVAQGIARLLTEGR